MTGTWRNPTGEIIAGGQPFVFEEFEVTLSRTKKGDKLSATGPLSAIDLNFWLTTSPIPITASINGAPLFTGNVDHSDYDFVAGTITISGRDTGAALIDATSSEKFLNQKPSDIVTTLAGQHGITADVDSAGDDAGKMFSSDTDSITHRGSKWSHITNLADQYGMTTYMTGGTLYFKTIPESLPDYPITYVAPTPESFAQGSFVLLKCSRSHILGRPIRVNVNSHHHRSKQINTATQSSDGGSGEPLVYNVTKPGISTAQATRIATKKLAEVQAHEFKMESLEIPGDETITARMSFTLSGTNSPFDQSYDGETIHHKLSAKDGFRTTVDCKNKKGSGSGGKASK